jgi:hypothetical protein
MSNDLATAARDRFERALHDWYLARYRNYVNGGGDDPGFLEDHMLRWEKWRENEPGLPEEVYAAHQFYIQHFTDADIGSDRVYKLPVGNEEVFAVRTTTDGDDSYVELYDAEGNWLAAGRANLEVMAWGSRDWLRDQAKDPSSLPPELEGSGERTLWGKPLSESAGQAEQTADAAPFAVEDDLPPDAREVLDKIGHKLSEIQESLRSLRDEIQTKAEEKIANIRKKADEEVEALTAEAEKKIHSQVKKAHTALKNLLGTYAKDEKWDEALAIRAQLKQLELQEARAELAPDTMTGHTQEVGKSFTFKVTGTTRGAIWGTDVYTADSTLATAAVHAGKVRDGETKVLKVTMVKGQAHFKGSTRQGVTSDDFDAYPAAFKFS